MIQRPLRRVLFVLLACFGLLFVQLNRIQIFDAEALRADPNNTRTVQRDFSGPRGIISTVDGTVVARSVESDGVFERQREYPEGELYAHVAGYLSFNLGAEGVERAYNDELIGRTPELELSSLADLFTESESTGQVVLSLRHDLQQTARNALGDREGSVVALDPRTGEILALWSWPSFDPNVLADHDGTAVNAAFADLSAQEENPLRARAFRDIFFPGSTFKLVTAASALEEDVVSLTDPQFPVETSYTPQLTTRPLSNFGGNLCGGDLLELLRQSCNAGFARIGAELLGPSTLIGTAQSFGFNTVPPIDLPGAVASQFPTDYGELLDEPSEELPAGLFENTPALAQAAIGQGDVSATPLQMALVAAGIANDGEIMVPRVVTEVRDIQGEVVSDPAPAVWQRPISAETAADLRLAMIEVVANGTGRSVAVSGLTVGAKTGTAQLGTDPAASHAWIVTFAGPVDEPAELVVAVLVEGQPGASEQTGGRVAGPIAAAVIEAWRTAS